MGHGSKKVRTALLSVYDKTGLVEFARGLAGHGIRIEVPQGDDEEVAKGVTGERAAPREPVLENVPPPVAPGGVVAEGGERHPEITGWQDAELLTQPSARPAVVGDRDDSGDVVADQAQCG